MKRLAIIHAVTHSPLALPLCPPASPCLSASPFLLFLLSTLYPPSVLFFYYRLFFCANHSSLLCGFSITVFSTPHRCFFYAEVFRMLVKNLMLNQKSPLSSPGSLTSCGHLVWWNCRVQPWNRRALAHHLVGSSQPLFSSVAQNATLLAPAVTRLRLLFCFCFVPVKGKEVEGE